MPTACRRFDCNNEWNMLLLSSTPQTHQLSDNSGGAPTQDNTQLTELPEDMAWLDGLSDEEYDAYWDEVERCARVLAA